MATTVFEVGAFAAPERDAAVVVVLHTGDEVELTGKAAPGVLAVLNDDREVYVPAPDLTLGSRAGINIAATVEDAPLRDAYGLFTIPGSQTVILTGATIDGSDAASFDGTGGWIDRQGLAR